MDWQRSSATSARRRRAERRAVGMEGGDRGEEGYGRGLSEAHEGEAPGRGRDGGGHGRRCRVPRRAEGCRRRRSRGVRSRGRRRDSPRGRDELPGRGGAPPPTSTPRPTGRARPTRATTTSRRPARRMPRRRRRRAARATSVTRTRTCCERRCPTRTMTPPNTLSTRASSQARTACSGARTVTGAIRTRLTHGRRWQA